MLNRKEKWSPDFQKTWYKVDKEAYIIIYKEAKEKMEDVLSESESITNKSIKMIAALVAILSFYMGFIIQNRLNFEYKSSLLLFLFFLVGFGILYLIFPKRIRGRGFQPKELIPERLDAEDDKKYQEQMLYYSLIEKLQEDIEYMIDKNTRRAKLYLYCIIGILIIFITCAINITLLLSALS